MWISLVLLCCSSSWLHAAAQSTPSVSTARTPIATGVAATPISLAVPGLPALITLPAINASHPTVQLSFPATAPLFLTFSICALSTNASLVPTVLVATGGQPSLDLGTRPSSDAASGGTQAGGWNQKSRGAAVWSLAWDQGFANWTAPTTASPSTTTVLIGLNMETSANVASITSRGNVEIQLGASSQQPLHSLDPEQPWVGDTTALQALIFTPLLASIPHDQPSYPNYTLPPAQLVLSSSASQSRSPANLSLILVPTESSPTNDGLGNSLCAVRRANVSTGGVAQRRSMVVNRTDPTWMSVGEQEGMRSLWVAGDLLPGGANYTAWVLDEASGRLSAPAWLATKEADFPCPLALPNAVCPSLSYAAALNPNATSPGSPLFALPDNLTSILASNLQAFSTSLLSQACGRDLYSHVSSCADCFAAYRAWLCAVAVPRCASGVVPADAYPTPATMARNASSPRNPALPAPNYDYTELLPCLGVCNLADRACPVNIQFRCPPRRKTAASSYGFVGEDEAEGNGDAVSAWPAMDRWGNRWCSG